MSAVSESLTAASGSSQVRPFDVRTDMGAVADLIEICFADTMDETGRSYLAHLRAAAQNAGTWSWAAAAMEGISVPLDGYVWQEGNRVVGNVSLIQYFLRGKRFYLIANVAVHPDYRRQGIARQLTAAAVEHARRRGVSTVWLQVRQENDAAVHLYQSLGFLERTRRTTWTATSDPLPAEPALGLRFAETRRADWEKQRAWLLRSYPAELSWHMTFDLNLLRPGLLGSFWRFFQDAYICQWAVFRGERLLGTVSWQSTLGASNYLWLAAPHNLEDAFVTALLLHARLHLPSPRPVTLDYPAPHFSQGIQMAGFTVQQTLLWMRLELTPAST